MGKTWLTFLCFLLVTASCDDSADVTHHSLLVLNNLDSHGGLTYPESLHQWNELKRLNGNSYVYHLSVTSFSGRGNITELRVENDIITSRVYQEYITTESGTREIIGSYRETAEDLGKHEMGARLLTIDELYETCATDYLTVNPATNTIHFETADMGLVTLCGFVPVGCVDDCFYGVHITAFEWLE